MAIVNVDLGDVVADLPFAPTPKEMLSITREGDKTLVRINSSSLSVIQECPRKAKYLLDEGWRAQTESPATVFGSAIHKALEVFYGGAVEERILPLEMDMLMMSFGHIVAGETENLCLRATRAFVEKAQPLKDLPESDKRSIQNGTWILFHYFKSFIDDPYIVHSDAEGPMIERRIEYTIFDGPKYRINYFGTIDLIVRHIKTGELYVCDHKTSSMIGSDFYNRLKPNHQYTGYLLGAREALGINAAGFLVNCVQVKEKPKTSRGSLPNFPRQITTRDEVDYSEFIQSVSKAVQDYINFGLNEWPLGHVNACAMYGGCTFLSVCSAPSTMRDNIMKAKFTRGER